MPVPLVAAGMLFALPALAADPPSHGSLFATPPTTIVASPVVFQTTADAAALAGSVTLFFGDGHFVPVTGPSAVFAHRYQAPGAYVAQLVSNQFGELAIVNVIVRPTQVRVPLGQVIDSMAAASPIFAGADTNIIMHYRITTPVASLDSGLTSLQALVDLEDANGRLVRRSDPFALFINPLVTTGVQTAIIPYSVPVDAGGRYRLVVWIRAAGGGTVGVGQPIPFEVLGGPDPAPVLHNQVKASGALVVGQPVGGAGGSLNVGMTTMLQWPTYGLTITGLYDPISHKSDPIFTLASATPGPVTAPDAAAPAPGATSAPTPAPTRLKYADIFGRAQTALPAFLGGGETLHGLDFTYDYGDMIYHAAAGYTQLRSATAGIRRGEVVDLTRTWSPGDALRFTLTDNRDDPGSFISIGNSDPLDGRTGYLEYDRLFSQHLKGVFTGARSIADDLVSSVNSSDGADKVDLTYNNAGDTYDFEYHNAGALFATGGGLGALADRVGGSFTMNLPLSAISQLGVLLKREELHSIFSREGSMGATLSISPPSGASLVLAASSDRNLSATADATTNSYAAQIGRSLGNWTWNAQASLTTLTDQLNPLADGVTRTGTAHYQLRFGPNALGFGINGQDVTGSAPNTVLGGTLDYGVSFGGPAGGLGTQLAAGGGPSGGATRQFELHLSIADTNTRQETGGGVDQVLNALLSYHLSPQIAPGIWYVYQKHRDVDPALDTQASGLRLRFDVQI